jgi:hypothetical protein
LQCSSVVAAVLQQCCCSSVAAVLLQQCCSSVAAVLLQQCCSSVVAAVLQQCCCSSVAAVLLLQQCCFSVVAAVLQQCCCSSVASVLLQQCCSPSRRMRRPRPSTRRDVCHTGRAEAAEPSISPLYLSLFPPPLSFLFFLSPPSPPLLSSLLSPSLSVTEAEGQGTWRNLSPLNQGDNNGERETHREGETREGEKSVSAPTPSGPSIADAKLDTMAEPGGP